MYDVAIIGGGASGLTAGIAAKRRGLKVIVLEANNRVGKKLLMTGNGKCNISNVDLQTDKYCNGFVDNFFQDADKVYQFFDSLGLKLKIIDGRYYPYSESANTVLNVLRKPFDASEIITDTAVTKVDYKDGIFTLNDTISARNVVLASGSNATVGFNSHTLLSKFGHKINRLQPSLVALNTDTTNIKGLSGLRAKVNLSLLKKDKLVAKESGEVLFKDNGLSGIVSMELSRFIDSDDGSYRIKINFSPDLSDEELSAFVTKYGAEGLLHSKIVEAVTKYAKNSGMGLDAAIKEFGVDNVRRGDIKNAQVSRGGLATEQFDKNCQSLLVKGLYAVGEVLDEDGACGGYNLFWAFVTGLKAGNSVC